MRTLRLPSLRVLLAENSLRYLSIDRILADATSHRSSRIDGFIVCHYSTFSDVIFLHRGTPVQAIQWNACRFNLTALWLAIERARKKSHHGMVSILQSEQTVSQLILASAMLTPEWSGVHCGNIDLKALLLFLKKASFTGFLQFSTPNAVGFMPFDQGNPRRIFPPYNMEISMKKPLISLSEQLITGSYSLACTTLPLSLERLYFEQPHPAIFSVMSKLFQSLMDLVVRNYPSFDLFSLLTPLCQSLAEQEPVLLKMLIDRTGTVCYNEPIDRMSFARSCGLLFQHLLIELEGKTLKNAVETAAKLVEPMEVTLRASGFFTSFTLLEGDGKDEIYTSRDG